MPTPPSQITCDILLKCKIQSLLWTGDLPPALPGNNPVAFWWLGALPAHHNTGQQTVVLAFFSSAQLTPRPLPAS